MAARGRLQGPTPIPRRQRESPIDPGYTMPVEPPQLASMTREQARHTRRQVGAAIEGKTGGTYRPQQAVSTRVKAVLSGITMQKAENQITGSTRLPQDYGWYNEHQGASMDTAKATGQRLGRAIDTSAVLSPRNQPVNERIAARSAAHIAMNPEQSVHVSHQLAPHVGSWTGHGSQGVAQDTNLLPGYHTLGDLTTKEAVSLGHGAAQVEKEHDDGHQISRDVSNITRRSAGRPTADRALRVARGEDFSAVTDAPKTASYAIAAHTASAEELTHNQMRTHELATIEGKGTLGIPTTAEAGRAAHPRRGQQGWSYDNMYPGMRKSVLEKHHDDPTAEDYVMNAMTIHEAHEQGKPSWTKNNAMDVIGGATQKGEAGILPPGKTLIKEQMLHAVNTEHTQKAAAQLGLTPVATQAMAWIPYRRQVLGEDSEWNAHQKRVEKMQARQDKSQATAEAPATPSKLGGLFNDRRGQLVPNPKAMP